jgi:hypothetical protein
MKSIREYQKEQIGKVIGNYFKLGWVFDKWYEKLILIGLCFLGVWKLMGFFT